MYSNRGWSYSSGLNHARSSAYRHRRLRLPPLPRFSPLPIAVLLVGAVAWYHFGFGGFLLHGSVLDADTGQSISGARVWSSRANTLVGTDGAFALDRVKPPDALGIDAPGYRAQSLRVLDPFQTPVVRLDPIGVDVQAVDADTQEPLAATLDGPATRLGDGRLRVVPVRDGQSLNLSAPGYVATSAVYHGQV